MKWWIILLCLIFLGGCVTVHKEVPINEEGIIQEESVK